MKKPAPLTEKPQKHGHPPLMQNWNTLKHIYDLKYKKNVPYLRGYIFNPILFL